MSERRSSPRHGQSLTGISTRLGVLERDFERLTSSVSSLAERMEHNAKETARQLADAARKIDQLVARQPPEDRWKDWLWGALTACGIIAMIYAGAMYWFRSEFSVASEELRNRVVVLESAKGARFDAIEARLRRLEGAFDWSPRLRERAE